MMWFRLPLSLPYPDILNIRRGFCFEVASLVKTSVAADDSSMERPDPRKNPTDRECRVSVHYTSYTRVFLIGKVTLSR